MGTPTSSSHSSAYSPITSPGGYHHEDASPPVPNPRSSYNPLNYGYTLSQHAQQPSSNSSNTYNFQPYVPAAYQQPNVQYPTNYANPISNSYQSPTLQQYGQPPPPPPPRPREQRYGNRTSQPIGSSPIQNYAHEYSYGQPPPNPASTSASSTRSGYTPPAPPPPPLTPGRDTFASHETSRPHPSYRQPISPNQQTFPDRQPSVNHQLPALPPRISSNGAASIASPPPRTTSMTRLNNSLPQLQERQGRHHQCIHPNETTPIDTHTLDLCQVRRRKLIILVTTRSTGMAKICTRMSRAMMI